QIVEALEAALRLAGLDHRLGARGADAGQHLELRGRRGIHVHDAGDLLLAERGRAREHEESDERRRGARELCESMHGRYSRDRSGGETLSGQGSHPALQTLNPQLSPRPPLRASLGFACLLVFARLRLAARDLRCARPSAACAQRSLWTANSAAASRSLWAPPSG